MSKKYNNLYKLNLSLRESQKKDFQDKAKKLGLKIKEYCLKKFFQRDLQMEEALGEFIAAISFVASKKNDFSFDFKTGQIQDAILKSFKLLIKEDWSKDQDTVSKYFKDLKYECLKTKTFNDDEFFRFSLAYNKKLYELKKTKNAK